jgi:hypothetical protein
MELRFVRGMWGMEAPSVDAALQAIRDGGFGAVEMGVPEDADGRQALREALARTGLSLVAQQWTSGRTAEDHARSFEEQYRRAAEMHPLFVNSHTGRDVFTLENNLVVFRAAERLESEIGVTVLHETHRGRALYCVPAATALLAAMPSIRLTADFSHWCCVHESLLEDQEQGVAAAIEASWHIHARVGHPQGPQVTHPGAPEWKEAVEAHVGWWKRIAERHRQRGSPWLTVCPEFGPIPYMPTLPWTRQPVADLWQVNLFMKEALRDRLG